MKQARRDISTRSNWSVEAAAVAGESARSRRRTIATESVAGFAHRMVLSIIEARIEPATARFDYRPPIHSKSPHLPADGCLYFTG